MICKSILLIKLSLGSKSWIIFVQFLPIFFFLRKAVTWPHKFEISINLISEHSQNGWISINWRKKMCLFCFPLNCEFYTFLFLINQDLVMGSDSLSCHPTGYSSYKCPGDVIPSPFTYGWGWATFCTIWRDIHSPS